MNAPTQKTCTKCHQVKEVEQFNRDKNRKDGRFPHCKTCRVQHRESTREEIRERNQRNYRENREEQKAKSLACYYQNRERRTNLKREWYARNKTRVREYNGQYQEMYRPRRREWLAKNRERHNTNTHRYRARRVAAEGTHTHTEWLEVVWKQGFACAHCGEIRPLARDHIIPLSKGGNNYISNIQGLCKSCNSSKGAKLPYKESA